MHDNGLLQYYREHKNSKGYLKVKELGFEQQFGEGDEHYMEFLKTPKARFHLKQSLKNMSDAEILLSQIYKKAGFDTTLYTPIVDNFGDKCVASNDVKGVNVGYPYQLLEKIRNTHNYEDFAECIPFKKDGLFLLPQYYTKDAIREYLKLNLFDMASKNTDRHFGNFFQVTGKDGKVTGFKLFDFAQSGENYYAEALCRIDRREDPSFNYYNLFTDGENKTRVEMLEQFKSNETIAPIINTKEVAEEIGSVDPNAVAKDIKQTIGYTVDQGYVDYIARSFDNMAEDFVQ